MDFNDHHRLAGSHAFLSASVYHWVNYDIEKLKATYVNSQEAARGVRLHDFASTAIQLGEKLPRTTRTINMYVNDAIGYKMTPEQILFYSVNAYGTADAISFKKNMLRIHDLKTGVTKASMTQLEVYTAFFCLEYDVKPGTIDIELRIYQNDQIWVHEPEVDKIAHIMDTIITFDREIEKMKELG